MNVIFNPVFVQISFWTRRLALTFLRHVQESREVFLLFSASQCLHSELKDDLAFRFDFPER